MGQKSQGKNQPRDIMHGPDQSEAFASNVEYHHSPAARHPHLIRTGERPAKVREFGPSRRFLDF